MQFARRQEEQRFSHHISSVTKLCIAPLSPLDGAVQQASSNWTLHASADGNLLSLRTFSSQIPRK